MSEVEAVGRRWIIDLIREQYDKAPDHYRLGDSWDDGAPAIADAIMAQLPRLINELNATHAVVPREPTTAMLAAGQKAWREDTQKRSSTLFRAMVEAAAPRSGEA